MPLNNLSTRTMYQPYSYQFHLIGTTDDICHLETKDIQVHEAFSEIALQTKVAWSKNVNKERDSPDQIILGTQILAYTSQLASWSLFVSHFISTIYFSTYKQGSASTEVITYLRSTQVAVLQVYQLARYYLASQQLQLVLEQSSQKLVCQQILIQNFQE